jgi:N-acylneuraminate cytidylyltransferase
MNNLCIIPARGGSKRIPRKNIKDFLGRPIIDYPIGTALRCGLFGEVMVSTDDAEIAGVARRSGAKVPFLRSAAAADDHATLADVLIEVVGAYEREGRVFENVCCILPTAPFVSAQRIREGYDSLVNGGRESVCPVVAFSYPILRALEIGENGLLRMIWPEHIRTRSQDLKLAYHDCGSFYWVTVEALRGQKTLFCKNGGAVVLPETEVQDIDTETDWKLAEIKYRLLHG